MRTYKDVYEEYLQNAPAVRTAVGRKRQPWSEWLSDKSLAKCDCCGQYGDFPSEVSHLPEGEDNPGNNTNVKTCEACTVVAWAWTNNTRYLRVTCPRGEGEAWLKAQAAHFGDSSGLAVWAYEKEEKRG